MLERLTAVLAAMSWGAENTEELRGDYIKAAGGRKVKATDAIGAYAVGHLHSLNFQEVHAFLLDGGWFEACDAYFDFFGKSLAVTSDAMGREWVLEELRHAIAYSRGLA